MHTHIYITPNIRVILETPVSCSKNMTILLIVTELAQITKRNSEITENVFNFRQAFSAKFWRCWNSQAGRMFSCSRSTPKGCKKKAADGQTLIHNSIYKRTMKIMCVPWFLFVSGWNPSRGKCLRLCQNNGASYVNVMKWWIIQVSLCPWFMGRHYLWKAQLKEYWFHFYQDSHFKLFRTSKFVWKTTSQRPVQAI